MKKKIYKSPRAKFHKLETTRILGASDPTPMLLREDYDEIDEQVQKNPISD